MRALADLAVQLTLATLAMLVMLAALSLFVPRLAQSQPGALVWSNGRPPECVAQGGSSLNVWERAKSPELRKYCDLVASAASKLAGTSAMAQAALGAAREADALLPGHAAPRILEGRALAALGKLDDALAAIRAGKERDSRGLDDPLALHSWARVLATTGHMGESADAYRALLPRTTGLSTADRATSAVEAGLVALATGPSAMDDAVAALREALRQSQDDAVGVVTLALALALDRRGDASESSALLSDHDRQRRADPRIELDTARAREILVVAPAEKAALVALALESYDPAAARRAWTEYIAAAKVSEGATPPWEAHARARLAALAARSMRSTRGGW